MTPSQSTLCGVGEMTRTEAEQLYHKNTRLAYYLLQVSYPTFAKDEDMRQEALLGLWKACITYDESKSKFTTYAGTCILNQVRMAMRGLAKQPDTVSLSTPIDGGEGLTLGDIIEDHNPRTDDGSIALSIFIAGLPEREQQLIQCKLDGLTQKQIAKKLGLSQVWVSRALSRLQQRYLKQEDQG